MILQALSDYYSRLVKDGVDIPLFGFSSEKISFCVVFDREGNFVTVEDVRDHSGKKPFPAVMTVPRAVKRTVGIASNLLWDNLDYTLGITTKDKPERALEQFEVFAEKNRQFCDGIETEAVKAFCEFMNNWHPSDANLPYMDEMQKGANLVFRMNGENSYIHEYPEVQTKAAEYASAEGDAVKGICLVTGRDNVPIAALHPSIKGVQGAQSSGASFVSFNLDSFKSYGKDQSYNAPVSEQAASNYATVLNHILAKDSRQKVTIGDTTFVFWSEKKSEAETMFSMYFGFKADESSEGDNQKLRVFLESAAKGRLPEEFGDENMKFYILGLSPNAARISVRFWLSDTLGSIHRKIGQHIKDCEIEKKSEFDKENPSIWHILLETALGRKTENIAPLLEGAYARSVLSGGLYPETVFSRIIGRIRADGEFTHTRMYALKGYINRKTRILNKNTEVSVSLDKENKNTAYLLGRLFAVLEKAQTDAVRGANTTIKDRFFGAASATPATVFPMLLRLSQHHIEKAEYGRRSDMMIQEIMEDIASFPKVMNLEQQGLFALGYYHQKNDLYKKKEIKESENE